MKRPRIVRESGPYVVQVVVGNGERWLNVGLRFGAIVPDGLAEALDRWLNAPYEEKE